MGDSFDAFCGLLVLDAVIANADRHEDNWSCLLYTSDAADERSSVDLGGRRIIKKKKNDKTSQSH